MDRELWLVFYRCLRAMAAAVKKYKLDPPPSSPLAPVSWWLRLDSPSPDPVVEVWTDPASANRIRLKTIRGESFETTDGGLTWRQTPG